MALKEKDAEEVQAKKAERDAIDAEVKQEEAERLSQLGRIAPLPETPNKLSCPEIATSADASGDINHGRALSHDGACNMIWSDSGRIGDDGFDGDPGPLDEKANESGDDCIEPDFKVDDEYRSTPSET
jgi:hypothetical protein